MSKILLVEDDIDISNLIEIHLKDLGFDLDKAYDGQDGLLKATNSKYNLIILDLMLPKKDGLEVCRELRLQRNNTPIMMLTSKSEEIDKVVGLELGADDYMTKPFSVRELTARVKAILRRVQISNQETGDQRIIQKDGFMINKDKRLVE
ncbi:MAG: response regulator, partial [Flavobacteriales bacterium]|nr:response regulator [Flavobacteriales bacterium]